jgi:geranylgeranyl diphosphate synthase type I
VVSARQGDRRWKANAKSVTERKHAQEILGRYRLLVDAEIAHVLEGRSDGALYEMVRYHLGFAEGGAAGGAGGKRVRAALCLLCCEGAGAEALTAAPAAAAVEMLHAFTLVHDDLADQDEMRRGRPTVWRRWGAGQAIAAGDALFALAQLSLGRLADVGTAPTGVCVAARELNEATLTICEGQQLDLSYEGRADVSIADYLDMVSRKTAALFSASGGIGAGIAGAPEAAVMRVREFGRLLGLAYQIRDDVLGIWGEPAELGKPVGSDLRRNKRSLPIIHAIAAAAEKGEAELADRLAQGARSGEDAGELAAEMERLGSRSYCEVKAQESLEHALAALNGTELRERPCQELAALARYLVERTS